jgi:hypothetical protein
MIASPTSQTHIIETKISDTFVPILTSMRRHHAAWLGLAWFERSHHCPRSVHIKMIGKNSHLLSFRTYCIINIAPCNP